MRTKVAGLISLCITGSRAAQPGADCYFKDHGLASEFTYVSNCATDDAGNNRLSFSDRTSMMSDAHGAKITQCQNSYQLRPGTTDAYQMCHAKWIWECATTNNQNEITPLTCEIRPAPASPSPPPISPSPPPPSPVPPHMPPSPGPPCTPTSFNLLVSKADYNTAYVSDGGLTFTEDLADAVSRFFDGQTFNPSRLSLDPSVPDELDTIEEEDESLGESYALEFDLLCGPTEEVSLENAVQYLLHASSSTSLTADTGSRITIRNVETPLSDTTTIAAVPPPPPTCIDPAVDTHSTKPGMELTRNGVTTNVPRYCHQLVGELFPLCKARTMYVNKDPNFRRCIPNSGREGRCTTDKSQKFSYCPSSPPATGPVGSLDVVEQQINVGAGDCDDCTSGGAVAGISIGTFLVGLIIGAVGLSAYFKNNKQVQLTSPNV